MEWAKINFIEIAQELFQNQFNHDINFQSPLIDEHSRDDIINKWLIPLAKLVASFLCNTNEYTKIVYLGERSQRPFPADVNLAQKKDYFDKVISKDLEIFKRYLSQLHADSENLLYDLHQPLLSNNTESHIRVTTIGDCLMTQLNTTLVNLAQSDGLGIITNAYYIGAWSDKDHDNLPVIQEDHHINIVALSLFTYWGHPIHRLLMKQLWEDSITDNEAESLTRSLIDYIKVLITKLKANYNATIFFHNSSALPWLAEDIYLNYFPWMLEGKGNSTRMEIYTGMINNAIDDIVEEDGNIILIDERAVVSNASRSNLYSDSFSSLALEDPLFHYNSFSWHIANIYLDKIKKIESSYKKKILFVDFDNTLWQGIMAEGKVNHYYNKQKSVATLGKLGIILVALSKNSPENIRWSEMQICHQDFACLKINWHNKVNNILDACTELNISYDQAILLDDSPEELALIKTHLPEILALDSTQDGSWDQLKLLGNLYHRPYKDQVNRNQLYRDNQQRQDFLRPLNNSLDNHALLSPLAITTTMTIATAAEIDRVYELLQRTNQFNCSANKYPKALLKQITQRQDVHIYCFSLKDKFGDMGLVGAVIVSQQEEYLLIENLVMSCRAMGYSLEHLMLFQVLKKLNNQPVVAVLIPNSKNKPAQSLYPDFGFTEKEKYLWHKPADIHHSLLPDWIEFHDNSKEINSIAV